jgi:hypothetical protein
MIKLLIYTIFTIGFLIAFIKIEMYFIYKSRENFRNLGTAYRELKQSRTNLEKLIK